jgi:hypothetical protein
LTLAVRPAKIEILWRAYSFARTHLKETNPMKIFQTTLKRLLASVLIVSMATMGFQGGALAGGIVSTDEAQAELAAPSASAERDKVNSFLARDDIREALVKQGVNPDAAVERVRAMTDAEVAQLAGRVDQAPAGGDVLGVLFTIFLVLLITDIIGWTKVFPFTRSIR